jgi:hypothetical protein
MKSGPSRVNAPLGGPVIPRSRRNLFSFGDNDNAISKADKWPAGGALHTLEKSIFIFWSLDNLYFFGLWRVCFPPCLVRPDRRLPVQGLSEGSLGVTGYPRDGAPGP